MRYQINQIYRWISAGPPLLRQFIKFAIDLSIVLFSIYLSFLLRFEWILPAEYHTSIWYVFIFFGLITVLCFQMFGAYSEMWVYWSYRDLKKLLYIHTSIVGIMTVANIVFEFFSLPRSIYALYWINSTGLFILFRLTTRVLMSLSYYEQKEMKKVLIVGAGRAGEMIVRQIFSNQDIQYHVLGFIDDDPGKAGRKIHGVKILGGIEKIVDIVEKTGVEEIIIAIPSANVKELRRIIKACEKTKVRYRTVPGPQELVDGRVQYDQIRQVHIEDLLGREESTMNTERAGTLLRGKRIMVTGAAGSIGSELCRQIMLFDPECIIAVDKDENKIFYLNQEFENSSRVYGVVMQLQNKTKLEALFHLHKPELIFHAAAYKHVPCMEMFQDEAVLNNVASTKIIADMAFKFKVEKFIQISTDKAVYPTNMMGVSKRLCELYIQHLSTKRQGFISVRFGNVIGSQGSVVTIFEDQIRKRQPITVTHKEMKRYFMSIREACWLTLEAATLGKGGCIFILDMGEEISITELAEEMIQLSGLRPYEDIPIVYTGLRSGEKLTEKLWFDDEKPEQTLHEKIFLAKPDTFHTNGIDKKINAILKDARDFKIANMLEKIKEVIPEFDQKSNAECGVSKDDGRRQTAKKMRSAVRGRWSEKMTADSRRQTAKEDNAGC